MHSPNTKIQKQESPRQHNFRNSHFYSRTPVKVSKMKSQKFQRNDYEYFFGGIKNEFQKNTNTWNSKEK